MSLWILDRDHLSLLLRDEPLVVENFNKVNPEETAITVITVEEQMRGRLNPIRRAVSPEEQVRAYTRLRETVDNIKKFKLLDFDEAAYNFYAELLRQRIRIGTRDLRIAAIALSVNGIVLTRNQQDFARVPGILLEDWTVA